MALVFGLAQGYSNLHAQINLRRLFETQVTLSATKGFTYTKTVRATPYGEKEARMAETRSFKVASAAPGTNMKSADGKPAASFHEELSYATELVFSDPSLKDFFSVTTHADTVVAERRSSAADRTALVWQRYKLGATGQLRYLETEILRQSWLYTIKVSIQVQFDEQGLYQTHRLKIMKQISLVAGVGYDYLEGCAEYLRR